MENIYYDVVIGEMKGFFDENGFTEADGVFTNETKAFKVEYDEAKSLYKLLCAEKGEGGVGEYSQIAAYLFDEGQTARDAESVGIDFADEARKALGVKKKRAFSGESALPTASGEGEITVNTLVAKLLATYPELKETYKEETAAKGKFLYLDFCTTYFVPEIRKTLDENAKKATKKLIDMMIDIYVTGDKTVSTLVVALLAAAIGTDEARFKAATDRMEECQHLATSINGEIELLVKNKKFAKAMKFIG